MNQNSGGKGPSSNKNMMGIVSIILWALVITLMVNFLYTSMSTSKSTKISYSEFLQMVREDKVERVLLESNKYTIYPKGEKRPSASTPQETSQPEVTPIPGLENLEEVAGCWTSWTSTAWAMRLPILSSSPPSSSSCSPGSCPRC